MSPKTKVAISFLQANLQRVITVAEIARSADLSDSCLFYLFKTDLGVSPIKYLKRLRTERARELLETSLKSVEVIAAEVGYNDCTHFMRDFKKAYGSRPSQFRAAYLTSAAVKVTMEESRIG